VPPEPGIPGTPIDVPAHCRPLPDLRPEATVQAQLDAYNARDIDAFMAHWAQDAQVYAFPATLLANGAAEIRARHIERFKEPDLTATLLSRQQRRCGTARLATRPQRSLKRLGQGGRHGRGRPGAGTAPSTHWCGQAARACLFFLCVRAATCSAWFL
jgi:hypothetical protein